jgi:hypothetical protein
MTIFVSRDSDNFFEERTRLQWRGRTVHVGKVGPSQCEVSFRKMSWIDMFSSKCCIYPTLNVLRLFFQVSKHLLRVAAVFDTCVGGVVLCVDMELGRISGAEDRLWSLRILIVRWQAYM